MNLYLQRQLKIEKFINKNAKLLKTPIIEIGYITSGKGSNHLSRR